jgi:hypothetical protein
MLPNLPEPIPERVIHGYLNDELASECLRAGLFFKPQCRWCESLLRQDDSGMYLCGGASGVDGCDTDVTV